MDQHSPTHPTTGRPARTRRARLIGGVIAVLSMVALGYLAWWLTHQPAGGPGGPGGPGMAAGGPGAARGPGGPGGRSPATTVGVATAAQADLPVTLEALGTVVAAATATVRPQVSGVVQKIHFTEGQMVKAGQVLATIDPRPFEMALLQARGQRQRDEAQLESARLILSRYRTLLEQDSIARQEVDTQAALVKQLEGTVLTNKASEGTAQLNLDYATVRAPIGGRVGLRTVDVGNLVGSGDAAGIAVITQLSPIDVEFAVPQDHLPTLQGRIAQGGKLPATALDRTRTAALATGSFIALDNQVDTQTGTVRAKARFANTDSQLFPSQFVNLRLTVNTVQDAVVVPVTAIRHGANGDFVYVLNPQERTVALRTVKRGLATVDKVQVVSGLKVGEQVIIEGADRLRDGASVVLPGDRPAGAGARGQGQGQGRGQGQGQGRPAQGAPQ